MYLDDGVSRSSAPVSPKEEGENEQAKGEYRQTRVTQAYIAEKTREIKVERIHDNW